MGVFMEKQTIEPINELEGIKESLSYEEIYKGVYEKIKKTSKLIPIPLDQNKLGPLFRKYGEDLTDAMYLHQLMVVILSKVGPVKISEEEWDSVDPEGVLTTHFEKIIDGHYRVGLGLDNKFDKDLDNPAHYQNYPRVETR